VPLAYALHIFSLRQLFARRRSAFESVRESLITDNKATKIVQ
jgi:hypothetical protein